MQKIKEKRDGKRLINTGGIKVSRRGLPRLVKGAGLKISRKGFKPLIRNPVQK